jgi:DNA invertase Pin-like site-specific DNA recombinase
LAVTEYALLIPRVSTVKQHEEDQTPGLQAYAERMGYQVPPACIVPVHGRSAFHGRHVKFIMAAVDAHVRNGSCSVVIFRHVDRSSREGVFKGFALLNRIMEAGARIEFSGQEFLNNNPGWIGPLFELAKEESEIKRDRALQGNQKSRVSGKFIGRVPWGYEPVDVNGKPVGENVKRYGIIPSAQGQVWVPIIFKLAEEGKSLTFIAEFLKAHGVESPTRNRLWNPTGVRSILGNTVYHGLMTGNPNLEFEPLVKVGNYKRANAAILQRAHKVGRSTVKNEPPFVKPVCMDCYGQRREGAPSGESPMYTWRRTDKWGTWAYYRCAGHGPARKSCGARQIPMNELDAQIDEMMANNTRPHETVLYVPGDDNDERRELITEKIKAATEVGDYELLIQLSREAMEIGPSERKATTRTVETQISIGDHWKTLSPAEKRDELARWTVLASRDNGIKILGPWSGEGRTIIADIVAEQD